MSVKICISLLLVGFVYSALSATCPSADDLPSSCECDDELLDDELELELSCTGSTMAELQAALSKVDRNSRLGVVLDEINIGTLNSAFFKGLNVVRLDISHCGLDSLTEEGGRALSGLEDTLEELIITSSFTEENVPSKLDLSHLRRLKELDLSFNAITDLGNGWFERGPSSLRKLVLSNNGIEKMGDRAFANLTNLQQLWLDGNRFGPIQRSMLPGQGNRLDDLQLDNNAFTSVPEDLFTDMPALIVLSLRTNGIRTISEKAFKKIWTQLEIFDIRGNPLECDSQMEWMFDVETDNTLWGRCEGPSGREGLDLEEFIQTRGV